MSKITPSDLFTQANAKYHAWQSDKRVVLEGTPDSQKSKRLQELEDVQRMKVIEVLEASKSELPGLQVWLTAEIVRLTTVIDELKTQLADVKRIYSITHKYLDK